MRSETEVRGALSRLLYGSPQNTKAAPSLLPKAKTPSPPKIKGLGAARAAAVAKAAKAKTPVKEKTPAKTPVKEKTPAKVKTPVKVKTPAKAEVTTIPEPAAQKKSLDRAMLITAKWPRTLEIAKKHMTVEEIEKVIGEPLVHPLGSKSKQYTPEKTKKLKAALKERLPA